MNIDNYVRKGGNAFHYLQSLQPVDYKSMTDRDVYITYMRGTGVKDNFIADQLDDMSDATLKKSAKQMRAELIDSLPTESSIHNEQDKFNEDAEKHFATIEEHLYYVAKNHSKDLVGINSENDILQLINYVVPHMNDEGAYISDIEVDLFAGIGNPETAKSSDYLPLLHAANELLNGRRNKALLLEVGKSMLFDKINTPVRNKASKPNLANNKTSNHGLEYIT
jgi:hypothetical protein